MSLSDMKGSFMAMPVSDRGVPVRQRHVSSELRALRKKAGLTCEDVARALGVSASKVSRMQTGKLPTSWQNVIRFEADAAAMHSFEPQLVPGLLQTPEYAEAVIRGTDDLTDAEIDTLVRARMTRHGLLAKRDAPMLHAIIDEAVLHRPIGAPGVLRRQLQHLITAAGVPKISLRVLPFAAGATPGLSGPLLILECGDLPTLVYLEHRENTVFLEDVEYVQRARVAMRRLRNAALAPEDSLRVIASSIDRMS